MVSLENFTPIHPVYKIRDLDWVIERLKANDQEVFQFLKHREDQIRLEKDDPYRGVYVLESWKLAESQINQPGVDELLVLGGNRSSKSTYAAWKAMRVLVETPNSMVWCFHTNRENSRSMQQPLIWQFFPKEWRYNHQSKVHNVHYSQKNGFTEQTFVLPNGSQCWFKNYEQDRDVIEGGMIDYAWCDELVPSDWIETLRYRLMDKHGKLVITFTPVEGYSATVKMYLQGAKTVETHRAELLKGEKLPLVRKPVYKKARIVNFVSKNNLYFPYENLMRTLDGASRSDILCRAYGEPTKARTARFPLFNESVHVLQPDRIPKDKVSRWLYIDPCPGRNWFMIWVAVDVLGRKYVYREWPSEFIPIPGFGTPGPWAEPDGRRPDGHKGQAQEALGFGVDAYIKEILRVEDGEPIVNRLMDSRYANAPLQTREHQTSLIEECAKAGMFFLTAAGKEIEEGVDLINSLLFYNREAAPDDYTNVPNLYVSENCTNTIYSLKEWTGEDGKTGACKDPIDCLRYMALSNCFYIDEGEPVCSEGGYY